MEKKISIIVLSFMFLVLGVLNPNFYVSAAKNNDSNIETIIGPNGEVTTYEELTYEEAMKRIAKYSGKPLKQVKAENPEVTISAATCSYSEVRQWLGVAVGYLPDFVAIIKKCYDGGAQWVDVINYASLYRDYYGTVKEFSGDVEAWVSDNQQGLYFVVNGDFYDLGTTSISYTAGANTKYFSIGYSVTSASNHFKYYYSGLKYLSVTGY